MPQSDTLQKPIETIEPDISECCNGYECLNVFAQVNIKQSDSGDYYASLRKDIQSQKNQS